ncbi:hypothetical protein GMJLKIPL_4205 [Methylobacterium isbiliense]|uniref:Uncharacterized protein n=1 Tax=Methylobacterium isbiliense TaxID=315478 RepID=A0ABQ4SGA1_9HYPH|nr:hypothetical protein GMJLKIPL_4205 [Methylobacterium isbiliense]
MSCWVPIGWLVPVPETPPISPFLDRNVSTFASASATRLRRASMLVPSQVEANRAVSTFAAASDER